MSGRAARGSERVDPAPCPGDTTWRSRFQAAAVIRPPVEVVHQVRTREIEQAAGVMSPAPKERGRGDAKVPKEKAQRADPSDGSQQSLLKDG